MPDISVTARAKDDPKSQKSPLWNLHSVIRTQTSHGDVQRREQKLNLVNSINHIPVRTETRYNSVHMKQFEFRAASVPEQFGLQQHGQENHVPRLVVAGCTAFALRCLRK